ncbi:MAG: M48 family metalloprotease, partial [Gammaproteobacteria bacterium]|nr:M48 family metalloprotease [Gammaproteobacteria bacterium]
MFILNKLFALLFILLATGFVSTANAGSVNIPKIGNDTSTRFSAEEEKILGETFMRQVRLELPVSDDPEVSDYIQRLGYRLISSGQFQTRHFSFFVVRDPAINAFAGPNGYIGVNAGLILNTEDESEVASVVAHEIAHVTQRHLERSFDKGEKLTLPTAAAIIAALVLGSQDINIAEAAILTTIAANYQTQLSFSRQHELEADHIGMQILIDSGYDPHSMPAFFEKLQKANRLNEGQMLEFLSTHPVTVKRISESRNRAAQFSGTSPASSQEYYLTKAKLRVNTSENTRKLQSSLEAELKEGNYANKVSQLYAYAWTLLLNEKYQHAREVTQELINLDRERIQYSILKGQ